MRLSIVLPVMDETVSLIETVRIAEESSSYDILEYIIVYGEKTTVETLLACQGLVQDRGSKVFLIRQTLPFLGGAIRTGFQVAKGSHILMMCSDLETDPHSIASMIMECKKFPEAVVTATRWHQDGGFSGYSRIKLLLNLGFQKGFKILYGSSLTDPTFGYRIFPTSLVNHIVWNETGHAFVFETLLRALRFGVQVREVPSKWRARREGTSHGSFRSNLGYFGVLMKGLFYQRKTIS